MRRPALASNKGFLKVEEDTETGLQQSTFQNRSTESVGCCPADADCCSTTVLTLSAPLKYRHASMCEKMGDGTCYNVSKGAWTLGMRWEVVPGPIGPKVSSEGAHTKLYEALANDWTISLISS